MSFFGKVDVQRYDVGKGCASLYEDSLQVRHCLPDLFANTLMENAGPGVSADLAADGEGIFRAARPVSEAQPQLWRIRLR